jgi:ribosomal protein S18 acetylase RimI-like enzyme
MNRREIKVRVLIQKYYPRKDFKQMIGFVREFFNHQRTLSGKKQNYSREKAIQAMKKDFKPTSKNFILVAKEGSKVIGFIRVQESEGAWFLREMMVDKKDRNLGIGQKLFEETMTCLKRKKVPALYLQIVPANKEALTFFTGLGIDRVNTIELETRLDGLRLPTHGKIKVSGFSLKY